MSQATTLRVATCNVLWDDPHDRNDRTQFTRRRSIVDAFIRLQQRLNGRFDVINFPEVQAPPSNNGRYLAHRLGYTQYSHAIHPGATDGIFMVVGPNATKPEPLVHEAGSVSRASLLTHIGQTSLIGLHPTHYVTRCNTRVRQMGSLLGHTRHRPSVIVLGDFNSLPWQKPRQLLEDEGFFSVLGELGLGSEPTFPTEPYQNKSLSPLQKPLIINPFMHGLPLDDICCKGLTLKGGGTEETDTDHKIVFAILEAA